VRIIAVANQKGGCGKTTTTINLAAALAERRYRVLVVDMDPQGHSTVGLGIRASDRSATVYHLLTERPGVRVALADAVATVSPGLDLVPADIQLAAIEQELSGAAARENRLRDCLRGHADSYDFCLIDCGPSVGLLTFNALRAADEVLVPIEPSFFSIHGLGKLSETIELLRRKLGQKLRVRALATMVDRRTVLAREVLDEIESHFGDRVCRTVIRSNVKLREAVGYGVPITVYDTSSTGYRDYRALAREVSEGVRPGTRKRVEAAAKAIAHAKEIEIHLPAREPAAARAAEVPGLEDRMRGAAVPQQQSGPEKPEESRVSEEMRAPERAEGAQGPEGAQEEEPEGVLAQAGRPVSGEAAATVLFMYSGPAADVRLAGDFNRWSAQDAPQLQGGEDGVWRKVLNLPPGRYEYKFIVDGTWVEDPDNPEAVPTPYGGVNSVIEIKP